MFSTNAKLNNNNYFICILYFIFPLLLSISCSCVMAATYPGYIKISSYNRATKEYILYDEDYDKTYYSVKIPDEYLQQHIVYLMSYDGLQLQTYSNTKLTASASDLQLSCPSDRSYPTYSITDIYFRIKDIQHFIPSLLPRITECVLTQDPGSCSTYSAEKVEIGKTTSHPTSRDIYAKGSAPAVLIIKPKIYPTIYKINFTSNVYGALATTANTFSNTAVEISNTNKSTIKYGIKGMTIKDGIEVNAGCTIKGKIAIDIQNELTTTFINRGIISGTNKAIYNFWRINGKFENYGIVRGFNYSFYDHTSSTATYEIHNQSGATIEGTLDISATKIENSGVIKGEILQSYATLTIENKRYGKIHSEDITSGNNGHIALNNAGEITVTGTINIHRDFTNSGTISVANGNVVIASEYIGLEETERRKAVMRRIKSGPSKDIDFGTVYDNAIPKYHSKKGFFEWINSLSANLKIKIRGKPQRSRREIKSFKEDTRELKFYYTETKRITGYTSTTSKWSSYVLHDIYAEFPEEDLKKIIYIKKTNHISNQGSFIAKSLNTSISTDKPTFNNDSGGKLLIGEINCNLALHNNHKNSIAKITKAVANNYDVTVKNHGSLSLQSYSHISSYTGDVTSELVLNLPVSTTAPTNPLLTVAKDASFDAGAKIILAAITSLQYLQNSTPIKILTAQNVTVAGSVEELLCSRAYDAKNKPVTAGEISSNSMLIKITNARLAKKTISADLKMANLSSLKIAPSDLKIMTSLLNHNIVRFEPKILKTAVAQIINTANPTGYCDYYTNDEIAIGSKNGRIADIYATTNVPAVSFTRISWTPHVNKINFKGNVYGALARDPNTFSYTAVEIDNFYGTIKDGIEIDPNCTIKGKIAIDIKVSVKGDLINRGIIFGDDEAIYQDYDIINGIIKNYGTIHGKNYALNDVNISPSSNFSAYEIHNYANARIEGNISTVAPKIVNSGTIKGDISAVNNIIIENKPSGKIEAKFIKSPRATQKRIILNNAGEIKCGSLKLYGNFNNSGTLYQYEYIGGSFRLTGNPYNDSYTATNTGYIRSTASFQCHIKLINQAKGILQLKAVAVFDREVENHGIIKNIGIRTTQFLGKKVTNYGLIKAPSGFRFDHDLDNHITGKVMLGLGHYPHPHEVYIIKRNIDNYGELYFISHINEITITSYHGHNTSALALTLPSTKPAALLTLQSNATFDAGAKIILSSGSTTFLTTTPQPVTILKAKNISYADPKAKLLHSGKGIATNSILIQITNPKKTATDITADLQIATTAIRSINLHRFTVFSSLLGTKKTPPVVITDPVGCYYEDKDYGVIDIGITASGQTPQDIYATGSDPAVLIVNPKLSSIPPIDKINFTANVYGTPKGNSSFHNTAVEINNTNNMSIIYGIEIASGCTIKGNIAINIEDTLTTNIINHGTISGTKYGIYFKADTILNGTLTNTGFITSGGHAIFINSATKLGARGLVIENCKGGLLKGSVWAYPSHDKSTLINHGTIEASYIKVCNITNAGSITSLNKESRIIGMLTNTGTIIAKHKDNNDISLRVSKNLYNYGYIEAKYKIHLPTGKQIANKGHVITGGISTWSGLARVAVNNQTKNSIAEFTDSFNEPNTNINNQGSVALQSCSSIGDYYGYNTSELVLTLPSSNPTRALLTVTNNASFDAGAKIILAASSSIQYLNSPTNICILTAKKLTINDNIDDLLYSRVDNAKNQGLSANSILIQITNASKTNTSITADLQRASVANLNLDLRQINLIDSLLKNKIVSAKVEDQAVLPPVIVTANPDKYYNYNKNNNTIDVGKTAVLPAANIYADSRPEAVQIGVPGSILPRLDKITFVSNVIGAVSPTAINGPMTKEAIAIMAQITNSYIVGSIEITSTATIIGEKGIAITASLTTNIVNYGTIAGNDQAIYFKGYGCILNGTITNQGIITSAAHALYSDTANPVTPALGASLVIENSKSAVISGGILVTGTASLVNHGSITAQAITIANITNSASITATDNINISRDLTNSGFIEQTDLAKTFILGSSNNAYTLTNSGYIKVGKATTHHKILNKKNGYIYLDDELSLHSQIINEGTIESSNKTNFGFHYEVTNSGVIIAPRGLHAHKEFYNKQHAIVESGPGDETLIDKELINSGIITVFNEITAKQNLTNSGTIEQTDLTKDFNLGDTSHITYTATNTGYIKAGNLNTYGALINYATIIAGTATNNELSVKGNATINNFGYMEVIGGITSGINSSFTNSGTALLVLNMSGADFNGIVNNYATIKAINTYLTTYTKKFTNTGSISIGAVATFGAGGVDNSATICVGNGLTAAGLFENKAQGVITITKGNAKIAYLHNYTNATITVLAGNLELTRRPTNTGYIVASGSISTTYHTFNNAQTAQLVTTIGGIKFGGITNNSATIISADAITALAAKFTNSGTVISNKGASSFVAIDNQGVITIKGSANSTVKGEINNKRGSITIAGTYTADGVFNNTSGVVTLGSLTGTQYVAKFNKKLTNSGTITAINQLETAQVDNSGVINAQHGLISNAEFTNTKNAIVNVTGAVNFTKFVNQSQATLTVTGGLATFTKVDNSGTIHALQGFTTSGFNNLSGAILKVDNGDLHVIKPGALINLGAINILNGHSLVIDDFAILINIANATLITDNIQLAPNGKALFHSPITAQQMTITNKGWVHLQAGSTVKDYIGHGSSELALALPQSNPGTTALLTTINEASFSVGAKIVLDATGQIGYLSLEKSPTITIITANNQLTTGLTTEASLESSLLYSRVYSSEVSHTLHSGSIFIKISEATITKDNKSLTAKLQLTTPASLDMKNLKAKNIKLALSLYESKDILSGKMASAIRPQGSPYPDGYINNRANKQINEPNGLIALGRFTNLAGYSVDVVVGISSFLGNVTNDGIISAHFGLELTKTAKFVNSKSGNLIVDKLTSPGLIPKAVFRGELLNQGIIHAKKGLITNLFTNFQDATLTSDQSLWKLQADATNAGTIYANAGLELTKTAKFVNLNTGSITITNSAATFSGEASNAGTINAGAGLTTTNFSNFQAATLTISGNSWQLTGETTNAGTIYAKGGLGTEKNPTVAMKSSKLTNLENSSISVVGKAYFNGAFVNQQAATITVTDYTRFYGASINLGTIYLNTASMWAIFDNRQGAILYNKNDSIGFSKDTFNNGTIITPRLTVYAKFTNLQHGNIATSNGIAVFIGEASNAGTINVADGLSTNKFTNLQAATITISGNKNKWILLGNTTNDGYIYANAGLELTKTAKFINLQHGSITISNNPAIFIGEASNAGTINALADLDTTNFTNSKAATLTVKGSTNFNQTATNDGYIYAYNALTTAKQFTNLQHGSITITKIATFSKEASNAGTINALDNLETDHFTNSQDATLTVKGLAHFQKAATNDGYIYAYNKLTTTKQFTNLQHGSITITAKATFSKEASNAGTINALSKLNTNNFTNSQAATLTVKGSTNFSQTATNDGYIYAFQDLTAAKQFTNLQHGSITIATKATFNADASNAGTINALAALQADTNFTNSSNATLTVGSALFKQELTNTGVIIAQGKDKDDDGLTVNGITYNLIHGSISVTTGNAVFAELHNSGTIVAAGTDDDNIGLKTSSKLYNYGSITITKGNFEIQHHATNDGYIKADQQVVLAGNIALTNRKRFIAKSITKHSNYPSQSTQFNNLSDSSQVVIATAEITDDFEEPFLNIDNQSGLLLHGPSTVGNYIGNATSELVLVLPTGATKPTKPLLRVQHDATFTQGSKIILAASSSVNYLTQQPTPITILTAKTLKIGGDVEELLYSRIYNSSQAIKTGGLQPGSILINITNATATANQHIVADLQRADITTLKLDTRVFTLVDSLLSNKIISAAKRFTNPRGASVTFANAANFKGPIYNAGIMNLDNNLNTKKFTNTKHGSMTVAKTATFNGPASNGGTMHIGGKLNAKDKFTNSKGATATIKDTAHFHKTATNSGHLFAHKDLISDGIFTNTKHGSMTVAKTATFNGPASNGGTMHIGGKLNAKDKFTNSKGATATVKDTAHFHKTATNSGHLFAHKDLISDGIFTNTKHGSMTVAKTATFNGPASNGGTMHIGGKLNANDKFTNSKGATATVKDTAHFHKTATNSGHLFAHKDLISDGIFTNTKHGSMTVAKTATFNGPASNGGTMHIGGKLNANDKFTNSKGATATVKDTAHFHKTATNSGHLFAHKDLISDGIFTNTKHGSMTVAKTATFNGPASNGGTMHIGGNLNLHKGIINHGTIESKLATVLTAGETITNYNYFAAKTLKVDHVAGNNNIYFNNFTKKAVAYFTDIINEDHLSIDNQGSFLLQGSSTVGNYIGSTSSELVLKLPVTKPSALLKVANVASFTQGAKIILAASSSVNYLTQQPTPITILTAKTLKIGGDVEELLYSRIYNSSQAIITKGGLQSNSILINITNATATAKQHIFAYLQRASITTLNIDTRVFTLVDSLLENRITSATKKFTNPRGASVTFTPQTAFSGPVSNAGTMNVRGKLNTKKFNNSKGSTVTVGDTAHFQKTATNSGHLLAKKDLITDKKFTNTKHGSMTVAKTATFNGPASNGGTMHIGGKLNAKDKFTNSKGATATVKDTAHFHKTATNSGHLFAHKDLISDGIFTNTKHGSMTVAKTATFNGPASNGGTMHIGGKLNANDKFTNSKGATATVKDTAHFHKTATNSGHLFAHKDLISDGIFTNTKHGSMTVAKTATFNGPASNGGTMHIGGKLNANDKFTNSKGATATVKDTAHFHKTATNSGHLFAHKDLISDGIFTNTKHGSMTVAKTATFNGPASNGGTMHIGGKLNAKDKFTNSKGATATVKDTAHFHKTATNSGHLFAHKDLISDGIFTNTKHGSMTVAKTATFNGPASNGGTMHIGGNLNLHKGIINHGTIESKLATVLTAGETITNYNYFAAKTLKVDHVAGNNNIYFNNFTKKAVAYFTDIINEDHLSIDNQGSFLLQGSSTVGNYIGSTSSELVLKLPVTKPSALLKVANVASFTQGAKIILAASSSVNYLTQQPTPITILTAKTLKIGGDVEELLYSRIYNSSQVIITKGGLQSNSILINITNATATANQHIFAYLQRASITTLNLDTRVFTLVDSLLENRITSATKKFTNPRGASVTFTPQTAFSGPVSNAGTMNVRGKLNTKKFNNSKGSTVTVGDTAHFQKTATNSGHLLAKKDLITDKKFTNTKHGSMTVAKTATFNGPASNGGTMHIGGKLNAKDKFTNSKGATATVKDTAHFHKTATNSGHLFAHKDLISDGIFTNTKHGSMTVAKTATFNGPASNGGTMHIGGKLNANDKFTNSKGATATVKDTAHFHKTATNSGHLFAHKDLISDGIFTNTKHGSMTVAKTATFNGPASNGGTMHIGGKLNANDKFTNSKGATATVKDTAHFHKTATNSGHLFAHKDLISDGIFTNTKHGSMTVAKTATFNGPASNGGTMHIGGNLNLHKGIINHGTIESKLATVLTAGETITNYNYFAAKTLKVDHVAGNNNIYFNNFTKKAVAYFTDIINEDHLSIDNQGSFLLQGSSTVGNYIGSTSSELVLKLPVTKPSALLKVANVASFTQGAKIILAASSSVNYLTQQPTPITILTAKTLKIGGDVEELLYSRIYNSSQAIITKGGLQSNSILINITNATATAKQHIFAYLQRASITTLNIDTRVFTLVDSLLENRITSATKKFTNPRGASVTFTPQTAFSGPVSNAGTMNVRGKLNTKKFNNSKGSTVTVGDTAHFQKTATNSGHLLAKKDLITDKKFTNTKHGSMTVAKTATFNGPASNGGTMHIGGKLNAKDKFTNSKGATATVKDTAHFHKTATNSGHLFAHKDLISDGIFTNTKHGSMTVAKTATFNGPASNGGTMHIGGKLNANDKFTNSKGATATVKDTAHFHKTATNSGHLFAHKDLISDGIFTNTKHGSMTVAKTATFNGPASNGGTMHIGGKLNAKDKFTNSKGATATVKDTVHFYKTATNSGHLFAHKDLISDGIFTNTKHGSMTVAKTATFNGPASNGGTMHIGGKLNAKDKFTNSKGATATVKDTVHFYKTATNSGHLFAHKDLISDGKFTNTKHGSMTVAKTATFNGPASNGGTMHIGGNLNLHKGIINHGSIDSKLATVLTAGETITNYNYFAAKTLKVDHVAGQNNIYFNNLTTKSVAYFTDIINESHLSIENQGSFLLQGSSTIGNYIGSASSELVLNLPQKKPSTLLTVANIASFTQGAKIILAATTSSIFITNNTQSVTIIAANKLKFGDNLEELLYSRVYDSSNVMGQTGKLQSSSILINITNATATVNQHIVADLQMTDIKTLHIARQSFSLADSLLNNKITSAAKKFTNPQGASITFAQAANFKGPVSNNGIMKVGSKLNTNKFTNAKGGSLTVDGASHFHDDATNDGNFSAKKDVIADKKFTNSKTSKMIAAKTATFKGPVSNAGIMKIGGNLNTNKFTNAKGGSVTVDGASHFHDDATNDGNFSAKKDVIADKKFTNSKTSKMIAAKTVTFKGPVSNAGIMKIGGNLNTNKFTNAKGGSVTVDGASHFHDDATNDGNFSAKKDVIADKKFTNSKTSKMIAAKTVTFKGPVSNAGIMKIGGNLNTNKFTNAKGGSLTVDGASHFHDDATNDGNFSAKKDVIADKKFTNSKTGKMIAAKTVTFKGPVSNAGIMKIGGNLNLHKGIINHGSIDSKLATVLTAGETITNYNYFKAKTLKVDHAAGNNNIYFNNFTKKAVAYFTDIINEDHLSIDNQASLLLQGSSTIGNYIGNAISELVLNLPQSKPSALLKVANVASFTQRAKIILAATTSSIFITNNTQSVTIIAANKLKFGDNLEELLYSRVYDSSNVMGQTGKLQSSSILINITNATATVNQHIVADLQMADITTLNIDKRLFSLVDSLLSNKITSAAKKFTNPQGASVTFAHTANLTGPTSNAGTMNVGGNLNTNKFTNAKSGTSNVNGAANFHNDATNDGHLFVKKDLTAEKKFTNSKTGKMIAAKTVTFKGPVSNAGIMKVGGNLTADKKVTNSKTGKMTVAKTATFKGPVSNAGIMKIGGNLTADKKVTNSKTGKMTVVKTATFNGPASNGGTMHIGGKLNANDKFTNSKGATATVKDTAHFHKTATNSGHLFAHKDLISDGTFTNTKHGSMTVAKTATFKGPVSNAGIMKIGGNLNLHKGIINHGSIDSKLATVLTAGETITNYNYFKAKTLKVDHAAGNNNIYFNNFTKKAIAEFTDIINEDHLSIDNQGSLLLQGSSTIGNYIGRATSELVVTLPSKNPRKKALVTTVTTMLDAGAKIILNATTSLGYLTNASPVINIIQASSLIIGGTIDEFLYSRVYDYSSNTINKQIQTNSMFISITEVTAIRQSSNDYLQAKLELATIPQQLFSYYQSKLTTSLLGNALLKSKQQVKTQLTRGATKATASSVSNIDVSGVEFYKSIDNHFMITKDIATDYNTRLIQQQQVRNRFYDYNIYEPKYNIRTYIARRNGNDKQHNWHEMVLSVGGVSEINTTTFGFTFVYLANKLATNNLPKTDIDGYHGIAYISYDLNGISLSASGIYGVTNYKNKNITGKHTNEFSLDVATSYRFIVEDISINLGVDSKFIGVNLSSHSYKDTANKVTNKDKSFISLGCFIEIATFKRFYHIFSDIGKVNASLHSSYTYITGIASNDNIIIIDANNNSKAISQDKLNNHRFYTTLKTQLDYDDWFYSLSLDYSKKAHQNIYGGNLAVGYRF